MPSTRPMVILFVIVFSVHLYYSSYLATALRLPQPSFSSQWIPVRSQAGDDSFLEVSHDLGEVPIYVQVLARSVDGPNAGVIFKGVGSAQTDDDASDEYGGIVYSYSHETVRVIPPTRDNNHASGCVVYTGGSLWGTAIHQCSRDAEVKVELWKEEDFPEPDFTSGFFDLSAENGASSFVEVNHGLNARPRLVSLQYTEKNADPDNIGFHYDGIGAAQSDDGAGWRHHGGIVFAYDNNRVRAWAPTVNDYTGNYFGALFSSWDGWSYPHRFLQGKVRVTVWGDRFPEPDITLGGHLQMGQDCDVIYYEMDLSSFQTSADLAVVEVESISQPNENFVFYGMGAQQARSGFKYGGLIFAYNNDKVTLWSPSEADGSVVNVIDGWGGEINAQSSKIANVTVKLWGTVKDACADDSHLKIDNRYRSSEFRSTLFTNSSDTICDSNIRKAWYRFVSEAGGEIPTTCINEGMCGTQYPVWINSPLPDVNFITTVDACINIDGDCCGRSLNIRMKNCQRGFFVYELRPLPTCPSAYCAGDREPCKPGQRSPTNGDFQPGCSELYPTLENPPNVQHVSQVATNQEVFFQCMFTASHWMNASYVVNWYLDDVLVKTEYIGGLKRTSSLYESEYQIGRQVSCDVSGSYVSFGIFGPAVSSNEIYIGFQVTPRDVSVIEGGSHVNVSVRTNIAMRCTLDITARPANYGIGRRDVVFDKCSVDIDYTDFTENRIVKVLAVRDCQNDGFYITTVDITPSSQCSVAVVPGYKETITISVVDVNCGHCYGTGDPHYVTFDGSSYDWYGVGDFVLFESPYHNFQVQVRTWKCWSVTCNCGIAIKEANDVISVDMCHGNFGKSSPRVRKLSEAKLVHGNKVYKHLNGKEFSVQMSSQRSVRVSADRYRLNIFLDIPSDDFNRSRGLCGTFDDRVTNDFTDRDGRVLQYVGRRPDSFSESWRVANGESLFENRPDDVIYSDQEFCACETTNKDCRKNIKEHSDQLNRPQQEWVDITEELNDNGDRRQVNSSGDVLLSGYKYYQDPDFLPQILTWPTRSGITEQQARDICTSAVQNSDSATSCSDVQEVDLFIGRDACVEDIGFSDSLLFLCDVVSIMEKHCEDVSLKNLTLYQKDINGKIIAPPSFLTSSMCALRCGGHGYCTNGKYHCHEGYSGIGCSVDLSVPPTIWYVNGAEHGFCDVREEDCQSINVIGDNILNSEKLKCQFEEMESLERSEKVLIDAHFQTFSEITCSLPVAMVNPGDPDDAGVTFKTVAVYLSNDNGNSASNALRFTIFDSKCRLCNGTDNCTLKPNTCDINGHCYVENESHPLNTDKKCVPDVDQYKWTVTSGQDSNKGAVAGAIIGGTLCTISAAAIVSVTGYMYFTRRWIFSSFRKKKVYPQTLQSNGEKSLDSWHSKSHMQMTGHK